MRAFLEIDAASAVPPFVQLYEQIALMAAAGALPKGARLPAVRRLASELAIAPGTVARTYRELERDGIIETRGRHGSFIRVERADFALDREAELHAAARTFAVRAHHLGCDPAVAVAAARSAVHALHVKDARPSDRPQ